MNGEYRGKRVDNGEWVYGYYFKTPLTDESTGSKPEDGWHFLSGRVRSCISTETGCVYEVNPETVERLGNMEIHFYENEVAPKDCLHGWIETRDAVLSGQNIVNTTQMGLLSTSLFSCGYRVFLNEGNEIKLGENRFAGREIKVGHDLLKLWMNGEFEIKE